MATKIRRGSANIFRDIGFEPEQAENLRLRAELMVELRKLIDARDWTQAQAAPMAALLAEFNAYLDRDHADPFADSVSYRQSTLWLSEDELAGMISEVRKALVSRMKNEPSADRTPHLVSTILFPTEQRPARARKVPA